MHAHYRTAAFALLHTLQLALAFAFLFAHPLLEQQFALAQLLGVFAPPALALLQQFFALSLKLFTCAFEFPLALTLSALPL